MAWCKTAVTPLLTPWRYCSLALNHRYLMRISYEFCSPFSTFGVRLDDDDGAKVQDITNPHWWILITLSFLAIPLNITYRCSVGGGSRAKRVIEVLGSEDTDTSVVAANVQLDLTELVITATVTADTVRTDRGHYDGLVQERRNSSASAMELRLSCIKPSIIQCAWPGKS